MTWMTDYDGDITNKTRKQQALVQHLPRWPNIIIFSIAHYTLLIGVFYVIFFCEIIMN